MTVKFIKLKEGKVKMTVDENIEYNRQKVIGILNDNIATFDCNGGCPDEIAIKANEEPNYHHTDKECIEKCFLPKLLRYMKFKENKIIFEDDN
ncbi:MAG: hypothetical protein WC389_13855 [Lutibacter sp.]|jgi:hypothetical protein